MRAFAVFFVLGALYHTAGLVWPAVTEPSPAWRHILFIAIDGSAALALWSYRDAFFAFFAALAAQQLFSHGAYGWHVWLRERRIDWASVGVLVFMPALLATLGRRLISPGPLGRARSGAAPLTAPPR